MTPGRGVVCSKFHHHSPLNVSVIHATHVNFSEVLLFNMNEKLIV